MTQRHGSGFGSWKKVPTVLVRYLGTEKVFQYQRITRSLPKNCLNSSGLYSQNEGVRTHTPKTCHELRQLGIPLLALSVRFLEKLLRRFQFLVPVRFPRTLLERPILVILTAIYRSPEGHLARILPEKCSEGVLFFFQARKRHMWHKHKLPKNVPGTNPGFLLVLHNGSPVCPLGQTPSLFLEHSQGRRAAEKVYVLRVDVPFSLAIFGVLSASRSGQQRSRKAVLGALFVCGPKSPFNSKGSSEAFPNFVQYLGRQILGNTFSVFTFGRSEPGGQKHSSRSTFRFTFHLEACVYIQSRHTAQQQKHSSAQKVGFPPVRFCALLVLFLESAETPLLAQITIGCKMITDRLNYFKSIYGLTDADSNFFWN